MDRIPPQEALYEGAAESKGLEEKVASAILDARASGKCWTAVNATGYSRVVVARIQDRLEAERGIGVYYSDSPVGKYGRIAFGPIEYPWMFLEWNGARFERDVDSMIRRLDTASPNTSDCTSYRLVAARVADALKRRGHAVSVSNGVSGCNYLVVVDPVFVPTPAATSWFVCPWW
jgi:hypothetical protein